MKNPILQAYVTCALWSSTDEHGQPLDAVYSVDDIHPDTLQAMAEDVNSFAHTYADLLKQSGLSDAQIGHDFWLTRNGHGAGFWDRGLGDVGEALSHGAKPFGEVYLYVGDDGWIHA